jgi:hypothetical protein
LAFFVAGLPHIVWAGQKFSFESKGLHFKTPIKGVGKVHNAMLLGISAYELKL